MQVTSEELNPCTLLLKVTCSEEQVRAGFDKAYKKAAKRIRIPGFRPGAAPKSVVKQYANPEYVLELARQEIVSSTYRSILEEKGIEPYGAPLVEKLNLDEESGRCEFQVKVPLPPKVEIGDMEGLEVRIPKLEVTDEEVETQIEELRKKRAKPKPVQERGAEMGDYAIVNIKPEGEEGEGRTFMTVVGQTFPQLDQSLLGMTTDDLKQADLTFPETFQERDWAGKTLRCQIHIRSLTAPELPELTDEFAKQLQAESVDELRERVRERIKAAKESFYTSYVQEQLLDQLLQRSKVIAPDPMWERVAEQRIEQIIEDASKVGKTLEDVAQENNMTEKELIDRIREAAKEEIHRTLLINEVFKARDMKLTQEDLQVALVRTAQENQISPQDALNILQRTNRMEELRFRAMRQKVLEYLQEHANVQEVEP